MLLPGAVTGESADKRNLKIRVVADIPPEKILLRESNKWYFHRLLFLIDAKSRQIIHINNGRRKPGE